MAERRRLIQTSEVGEYVFCRRAWWLGRVRGEASINVREMEAGTGAHARHGQRVAFASYLRWAAFVFLALAGVMAVIWVVSH